MIQLSQAAIAEVSRIKSKQHNPHAVFRLGVKPGGCADFYYIMVLDETIAPEDQVQLCDSFQIVVDPESLRYLDGVKIDYTEDLMGGGFRFDNPNALSHCGCGNSFSMNS